MVWACGRQLVCQHNLIGSRPLGSAASFLLVSSHSFACPHQSLISVKGIAGKPSYTIAGELETSPETCNCVAASGNGQLIAAAIGKNVRIYASNPSGFHLLSSVQVRCSHGTALLPLLLMFFFSSSCPCGKRYTLSWSSNLDDQHQRRQRQRRRRHQWQQRQLQQQR